MAWPMSQDYNEAIQAPSSTLADPDLKAGQAVLNDLGLPLPRSGNFADVYEFQGASGTKWAVKCFTREVPGLQQRYSEISKHLIQARLPFTVDFQYLAEGIRIHGQWYPILKMRWVDGLLFNQFVRDALDKRSLLEALGQIWLRMAMRLREAGLAHADLQHGNVILVAGNTLMVDGRMIISRLKINGDLIIFALLTNHQAAPAFRAKFTNVASVNLDKPPFAHQT